MRSASVVRYQKNGGCARRSSRCLQAGGLAGLCRTCPAGRGSPRTAALLWWRRPGIWRSGQPCRLSRMHPSRGAHVRGGTERCAAERVDSGAARAALRSGDGARGAISGSRSIARRRAGLSGAGGALSCAGWSADGARPGFGR